MLCTRLLVLQTEEVTNRVSRVTGLVDMSVSSNAVLGRPNSTYTNMTFAFIDGLILRASISEDLVAPALTIVGGSGLGTGAAGDRGGGVVLDR